MPTSTKPDPPPESLAAALAILQTRLPHVGKDQAANIKPGFSYKYADLAAISKALLPIMGELGLSFSARPTLEDDGRFVLAYTLRHVSGEDDRGLYPLPSQGTPQQVGSAITYARRYSLCAVTGAVADEDDDAQAAEAGPQRTPTDAELKGPDLRAHNRLRREGAPTVADLTSGKLQRGVTRDPGPDEFSAVDGNGERHPPGDLTAAYPPGQRQLGALQAHFKRLGFEDSDREERLAITAIITGAPRDITSSKDLTQDQVKTALKVLEKCRDRPQLTDAVAALGADMPP